MKASAAQCRFVLDEGELETLLDDVVTWVPPWLFLALTGYYGGRFGRPFEGARRGDLILLRSKARTGWVPWTMVHLELRARTTPGDRRTEVIGRTRAPTQGLGMAVLAALAIGFVVGFPGNHPAVSLLMLSILGLYWALMRKKKQRELALMCQELSSVLEPSKAQE